MVTTEVADALSKRSQESPGYASLFVFSKRRTLAWASVLTPETATA
jgi:hypothetical protein